MMMHALSIIGSQGGEVDRDLHPHGRSDVSVIIPCHNYGSYLADAIESVLAQNRQPAEIVVVDDGSTDNSLDVARRYERHGIRILSHANIGIQRTMNDAVRRTCTKYFIRLDADDMLAPDYIRATSEAASRSRAAFVYTDMILAGTDKRVFRAKEFSLWALMRSNYINASALILRQAFLRADGYYEPKPGEWDVMDDWELWLRMAALGYRGHRVPEALLVYRRHNGSRNRGPQVWPRTRDTVSARHPELYRRVAFTITDRRPLSSVLNRVVRRGRANELRALDQFVFPRRGRQA